MVDWKKFVIKEFWTKKEISYQYVHFTNAMFITLLTTIICKTWYMVFTGLVVGLCVEVYQWIGGNHKVEDAIRDLIFWTIGGIFGYWIWMM